MTPPEDQNTGRDLDLVSGGRRTRRGRLREAALLDTLKGSSAEVVTSPVSGPSVARVVVVNGQHDLGGAQSPLGTARDHETKAPQGASSAESAGGPRRRLSDLAAATPKPAKPATKNGKGAASPSVPARRPSDKQPNR